MNSSSDHPTRLFAVVAAAGIGSRMNADKPKQFIGINGRSMLDHTVDRLLQLGSLVSMVVVLDEATYNTGLVKFQSPKITTCIGGGSRAESVRNGILNLVAENRAAPASAVLVHDAARPCVRVSDINRLIDSAIGDENGGILAMPVIDTLKRVDHIGQVGTGKQADGDLRIAETIDRSQLWRAATPQLFPCELLLTALTCALEEGADITDEASAMQHAGYKPRLIECSADNIKVTTPTDLALAEHTLATQQAEKKNV